MLVSGTPEGARVAAEIASLLNQHNRLQQQYDGTQIQDSEAIYFPALHQGQLLGSVALRRISVLLSEVRHLVVAPRLRGFGLGKLLVDTALRAAQTPFVYAFVRTDNAPSLALFASRGFQIVGTGPAQDHHVHLLLRTS